MLLLLESYIHLARIDILMRLGGVRSIHALVGKTQPASSRDRTAISVTALCHAVDLACVFYTRRVFCLQRSAATTLLLRRYGHTAELVLGAQVIPFRSHAWVEIEGTVVNDKPYMLDIYQVLERC
jgi:hypothetical protein